MNVLGAAPMGLITAQFQASYFDAAGKAHVATVDVSAGADIDLTFCTVTAQGFTTG
jgi:hypothetical protein